MQNALKQYGLMSQRELDMVSAEKYEIFGEEVKNFSSGDEIGKRSADGCSLSPSAARSGHSDSSGLEHPPKGMGGMSSTSIFSSSSVTDHCDALKALDNNGMKDRFSLSNITRCKNSSKLSLDSTQTLCEGTTLEQGDIAKTSSAQGDESVETIDNPVNGPPLTIHYSPRALSQHKYCQQPNIPYYVKAKKMHNYYPAMFAADGRTKRRYRTGLSKEQYERLTESYDRDPFPTRKSKETLAIDIGLSLRVVHVWFQSKLILVINSSPHYGSCAFVHNCSKENLMDPSIPIDLTACHMWFSRS